MSEIGLSHLETIISSCKLEETLDLQGQKMAEYKLML